MINSFNPSNTVIGKISGKEIEMTIESLIHDPIFMGYYYCFWIDEYGERQRMPFYQDELKLKPTDTHDL